MKKAFAAILLLFYFTATCGIVINSHYCMRRLVSVKLFERKSDRCGRCGMALHMASHKGKGCCRQEVKILKLSPDHNKTQEAAFLFTSLQVVAVPVSDYLVLPFQNIDVARHFHNHSPPLLSEQDIYLQDNVFRI